MANPRKTRAQKLDRLADLLKEDLRNHTPETWCALCHGGCGYRYLSVEAVELARELGREAP